MLPDTALCGNSGTTSRTDSYNVQQLLHTCTTHYFADAHTRTDRCVNLVSNTKRLMPIPFGHTLTACWCCPHNLTLAHAFLPAWASNAPNITSKAFCLPLPPTTLLHACLLQWHLMASTAQPTFLTIKINISNHFQCHFFHKPQN